MSEATTSQHMSPKLNKVAELARKDPKLRLRSLAHVLDEQMLLRSFHRLRSDAAVGVDEVTKEQYGNELEANIRNLHSRMKNTTYRHQPIRRVYIPKAPGKLRPLGISSTEDKIVQGAVAELLGALYEPIFYDGSYGFRSGRSAHDAIKTLYRATTNGRTKWILEADIEAYFDSIDRQQLTEMLRRRIDDESLLRIVGKCLHVGVLDGEEYEEPDRGTAQGSVLSPLLGNVYLHYVLDEWFLDEVRPRLRGEATLVRYADDFVIAFELQEDAERVLRVLHLRMERFGLKLSPEKTRLVRFRRPDGDGDDSQTFDFLGFTWFWGRGARGRWTVRLKTRATRMRRAIAAITGWCRLHRHDSVRDQHLGLSRRLRGHFNYFTIDGNTQAAWRLVYWTTRIWHKWLRRRSDRSTLTWVRFQQLLKAMPLPRPVVKRLLWTRAT